MPSAQPLPWLPERSRRLQSKVPPWRVRNRRRRARTTSPTSTASTTAAMASSSTSRLTRGTARAAPVQVDPRRPPRPPASLGLAGQAVRAQPGLGALGGGGGGLVVATAVGLERALGPVDVDLLRQLSELGEDAHLVVRDGQEAAVHGGHDPVAALLADL